MMQARIENLHNDSQIDIVYDLNNNFSCKSTHIYGVIINIYPSVFRYKR